MSVVRKIFAAGLVLSVCLPVVAQANSPSSLCQANERVLFTCPIGKKLLSVCASSDLDDTKGMMQYRFGLPDKLELVHPEVAAHPKRHFKFQRTYSRVESAEIQELEFQRGAVTYAVFTESIKGKEAAGINVTAAGKTTTLKCKALDGVQGFSEINSLGLPEM